MQFGIRSCEHRRAIHLAVTAVVAIAAAALTTSASAVQIESSPQNTAGGFRHNAFHTAATQGGQGGTVLAWFDLDPGFGAANDWDLGSGLLTAHFDIFSDDTLSTVIGTAVATGTIPVADLAHPTEHNVIVGSLTWTFDLSLDTGSSLYTYLDTSFGAEADDTWENITTQFADVMYATSPQGRTANSFDGTDLTLWGADGTFEGSSLLGGTGGLGGFGNSALLGVDLVLAVPEPNTALLLGLGLVSIGARRRGRASA